MILQKCYNKTIVRSVYFKVFMNTISLPPFAPVLMESTRAIGYSVEAAIADLIDNSIVAHASHVDIDFFPIGDAYISIFDDGEGMDFDTLIKAMKYGSRNSLDVRDEDDLGRYGLGLKMASLSQCRVLTVISKKQGIINGCQWDLNYITNESKDWSLILLDNNAFSKFPNFKKLESVEHGTLVVWQDLDRLAVGESQIEATFREKTETIREHVALVFHRYISGEPGLKKLDIRMNELSVEPKDPFLSKKSTQLMDEEIILVRGRKIKVKPFILPHVSKLTKNELKQLGGKDGLRRLQGFYVYRNKRLLVWGTWFRLMRQGDLTKLARVQVDIPNSLDDLWTLDIKKSTATPPEVVKNNLKIIIDRIAEGSRRTWTFRGKKEISDTRVHVWDRKIGRNGEIFYEINYNHPMIAEFTNRYPNSQNFLSDILKQIALALPLNQLYIDLTNDEKISNDSDSNVKDVIELLKKILNANPDIDKCDYIETLKTIEPFCNYEDEIDKAIKRGEIL